MKSGNCAISVFDFVTILRCLCVSGRVNGLDPLKDNSSAVLFFSWRLDDSGYTKADSIDLPDGIGSRIYTIRL
jgi:hypothetical protein